MRKVLKNGKIYVENSNFQEAILIEDGIVKDVGSNEEILATSHDEVIDLKGKTVVPGLNDSHLHITYIGSTMSICNLNPARSIEDIIKLGKEFLEENPDLRVLSGRGWNQDYFTSGENRNLNRHDLDRISTEIPIIFTRVCGHVLVTNSKAIEVLNIDENTRVDGGVIELGSDGKPNGLFNENANELPKSLIPEKSDSDIENDFLKAEEYLLSHGVTSIQSSDVNDFNSDQMFRVINNLYINKKAKIRYSHQFNYQELDNFRNFIVSEYNTYNYDDEFLSKGALKLFTDGSLGGRTAYMLKEYKDDPGNFGVSILSGEELENLCRLAEDNNIRVVIHAIGDGAIENVINAYEKVMEDPSNPNRHGIVHNQITHREQLNRIVDLNIPVMYQPIFLDYDMKIVEDRVGKDLTSTSYAFDSLRRLGGHISFGTDAPVEDSNPFPNLYCAVTRKGLDEKPDGGFYPEERLTVEDAIDAYTIGSAYNEFKETFKGRLQPGFVADLVVLDRDIFTIPQDDIKNIEVEMTMINGSVVYQK